MNSRRKAIEKLYKGVCTIKEFQSVKDPETKRTKQTEVVILKDQPCRLSIKTVSATGERDNAATISQVTKLFIAPEVEIKPGTKIVVTQNQRTTEYSYSGFPAVYPTHQEIVLKLFEGWA
ncbi:ABC transporter ATP-binding protein [Cytobacillus massiliigabonensis]|uniref:ABC transporter ATP-binding protein n=1 Tax=Cytobacillus massiliigabonensis TaxID=1871011 RepID=UPI001C0FD815|nr:ABC transporter ATP-binding protein [Cytobacillus massiliigabonensis]